MQATLTAASLLRNVLPVPSDLPVSQATSHTSQPAEALAVAVAGAVDSSALLQGQKAVAISHNGSVYRLQATKLGKLILTK
ncbi:MAG: hemin uptake protein HemP [Acidovorax sp.]|nr:hemin uptake protein HemP [Acidovorax sp.]